MLPRFPAGAGTREIGSKRKRKREKEEFLKGKCNQGHQMAAFEKEMTKNQSSWLSPHAIVFLFSTRHSLSSVSWHIELSASAKQSVIESVF